MYMCIYIYIHIYIYIIYIWRILQCMVVFPCISTLAAGDDLFGRCQCRWWSCWGTNWEPPKMTLIIFSLVRCDQYSPEMLTFCFVMFFRYSRFTTQKSEIFFDTCVELTRYEVADEIHKIWLLRLDKTLGQSVQELEDIGFPWDDDGRKKWAAFAWEDHWSFQGLGGWFIPGNNISGTDGSITNKIKKRETPRNIDIHSFFSHLVAEPYMTQ